MNHRSQSIGAKALVYGEHFPNNAGIIHTSGENLPSFTETLSAYFRPITSAWESAKAYVSSQFTDDQISTMFVKVHRPELTTAYHAGMRFVSEAGSEQTLLKNIHLSISSGDISSRTDVNHLKQGILRRYFDGSPLEYNLDVHNVIAQTDRWYAQSTYVGRIVESAKGQFQRYFHK